LLPAAGLGAGGQGRPVRADLDVRLEPFTRTDDRGTHTAHHARFAIPRALVALAHHPGRVGVLGAVTAAAGLAAQDATHRVLAVDAVLALAGGGTLDSRALAEAMRTIAPATRLPRWAPSLEQIAATIGSRYVVDVLTDLLPHLPRDTRGLVKLLDVLAEETTRIAQPATDPTVQRYLRSFTGSTLASGVVVQRA